jgi:UPF0716 protein FxsA
MSIIVFALLAGEILLILAVGRAIGGLATVGLLFGTSALGMLILRQRTARAARFFSARLRIGRPRSALALRGEPLLLLGGVLLLLPGLISDGLGVLLLALGAATWRRPPPPRPADEVIDVPFQVHDD